MTGSGRFVSTPIYYASGEPHIGHAYTTILADALARFWRREGSNVLFLTGTDEHGPKIEEEASRRGVTPIELCDTMADRFLAAWEELDISHDRFIRTTEDEHKAVVTAFLTRLHERGHIYEGRYSGWYCIHEERFWTEKDLGPGDTCPDCSRPVRRIEEKNYFFRMSAFREDLLRHIDANPDWIVPRSRLNEIRGFLEKPLADLSISRPKSRVSWGVELPFDRDHVAYVWVDALINYLTASGAIDPDAEPERQGFDDWGDSRWPCDLHVVGKDIITTHAVYWPTLLMGVGLPAPARLLAHGWWVVGDTKMSKSLGNVVDPLGISRDFGADAVRWYLLREMPTGSDASYTPERFLARYSELANILGNLASRVVSMIRRYRDGIVPDAPGEGLAAEIEGAVERVRSEMERLRLHEALAAAMELARIANGYVEASQPWKLAKLADGGAAEELDEALASLARVVLVLCALFEPVTPNAMVRLARCFGTDAAPTLEEATAGSLAGRSLDALEPLFPKVESLR
ncbi:MAG: methionine--tRNA ligase [Gemmatimonadetes bacterium]|nr:methionine--tRNA ligase [Gemmatimonadota bacterium]